MKEYRWLIIAFIVCMLAITGAVAVRLIEQKKLEGNLQEYIDSVDEVSIYDENVNIYSDNKEVTNVNTQPEIPAKILTREDLINNIGDSKTYTNLVVLFTAYRGNSVSLTTEKLNEKAKITYEVACDIAKSDIKMVGANEKLQEITKNTLNVDGTYKVKIEDVNNDNIVRFIIVEN